MELSQIKAKYGGVGEAYRLMVPVSVVGANKIMFDLFNAVGSNKNLIVLGVYPAADTAFAVAGVVGVRQEVYRTSAVGTGGTAQTPNSNDPTLTTIVKIDSDSPDIPSQVTARLAPAGGVTLAQILAFDYIFSEETNQASYLQKNLLRGQSVTCKPGQGLVVKQGSVAGVGGVAYMVDFLLV